MLVPSYFFDTVYDIPLSLLHREGVRCLLMDIDNTLVPYDVECPTAENRAWFDRLSAEGIQILFVSNNHAPRVERYVGDMDIPYAADAGKPGVKKYRALTAAYGFAPGECAAVGDQIFTDVLAASRFGAKSILVRPIKPVENTFFRFKRFFETPFVWAGRRKMRRFAAEDSVRKGE